MTLCCMLTLALQHNLSAQTAPVVADWPDQSDELPGLLSGEEVLIGTGLILSGALLGLVLFRPPKPAFSVKPAEVGGGETLRRLQDVHEPLAVRRRGFFSRTVVGTVRADGRQSMHVAGRTYDRTYAFDDVKEVMDLRSAARRARAGRMYAGLTALGAAASFFYYASLDDTAMMGDSNTLDGVMGAAFLALGAYGFVRTSRIERDYAQWQRGAAWRTVPAVSFHGGRVGVGLRLVATL